MQQFGYVTVDGKEDYSISVFDHGLLYGDGVYETVRVFKGKAFLFDEHIDRLFASAKGVYLKIPDKPKIIALVKDAYKKSGYKDAFIRILITRGSGAQGLVAESKPTIIIIVNDRKFNPLGKKSVTITKIRRINKTAIDSKIKSLNYMNNILARLDANRKGFDDAIMLNDSGYLTESTTSNLFIVKNGKIYTPSAGTGILQGAVRKAVIDNFKVTEKELKINDLMSADEAFLTGSVDFIISIKQIDKVRLKKFDTARKVFDRLIEITGSGYRLS